jgi:hypothetical protein
MGDVLNFLNNDISREALLSTVFPKLAIQLSSKRNSPPWSILTPWQKFRVYCWIATLDAYRSTSITPFCSIPFWPMPKSPKCRSPASKSITSSWQILAWKDCIDDCRKSQEVSRGGEPNRYSYIGRLRGIVPWNYFRDPRKVVLKHRAYWCNSYSSEVMLNKAYKLTGICCSLMVNYT